MTAPTIIDGAVGVDFTQVSSPSTLRFPPHRPGTIIRSASGKSYLYVTATATIAVGENVAVTTDFNAAPGYGGHFAETAIPSGFSGWVVKVEPVVSVLSRGEALSAQDYYRPTDAGFAAAVNRAIDAVSARGGGRVVIPNLGTVFDIENKIVLKSNVELVGIGRPTLKLKDGVNKTVIEGENFLTLAGGSSPTGAISQFGIRNLIIDGNRANNASPAANEGHGVATFGRNFVIEDLEVVEAARSGLFVDYVAGGLGVSPYNGRIARLTISGANEHGWYCRVSDLHADDVNIRNAGGGSVSTFDGLYAPSGGSVRLSNINVWSSEETNFTRYCINLEGTGNTIVNAHVEAGGLANLRNDGNYNNVRNILSYNARSATNIVWAGDFGSCEATMYPGFWAGTTGLQIGRAGRQALANNFNIRAIDMTTGIVFTNSGGLNNITYRGSQPSGAIYSGTMGNTDHFDYASSGTLVEHLWKLPTSSTATAAAGSNSAGATVLTRNFVTVTTSGASQGVRIPATWVVQGGFGIIVNAGANAVNVYPHSAGNFQGLTGDVAVSLPSGAIMFIYRAATGGWAYIKSA